METTGLILNGEKYLFAESQQNWQPSSNTIIYLPLDSTNQATNFGILNRTFVASGVTWGNNYAETTGYGSGIYDYQNATFDIDYTTWTASVWCNISNFSSNNRFDSEIYGINNYGYGDNKNLDTQANYFNITDGNRYTVDYHNNYIGDRHNVVVTSSGAYIDGIPLTLDLAGSSTTINTFTVFLLYNPRSGSGTGVVGKVSQFIFENVERTEDQIVNYYNSTKSLYGIS